MSGCCFPNRFVVGVGVLAEYAKRMPMEHETQTIETLYKLHQFLIRILTFEHHNITFRGAWLVGLLCRSGLPEAPGRREVCANFCWPGAVPDISSESWVAFVSLPKIGYHGTLPTKYSP